MAAAKAEEVEETPQASAKEKSKLRKMIHWSVWMSYRHSSNVLGMAHPLTQALHSAATEVSKLPEKG